MKILDFDNIANNVTYVKGIQNPAYIEIGKIENLDITEIILSNLCDEKFLSEINEKCNTNYNLNTNISDLNLKIIYENLSEGIYNQNYMGYNSVRFSINDILFDTIMKMGPEELGGNIIFELGHIVAYKTKTKIKLDISY